MFLPKLLPRAAKRRSQQKRQALEVSQFQITTTALPTSTIHPSSTAEGRSTAVVSTSSTTNNASKSEVASSISSRSSSISSARSTSATRSISSKSSTSLQQSTITQTIVATASPTSTDLIFVNSFPADFPRETFKPKPSNDHSRGYLFLPNSQLGDSALIFSMMLATFFIFTILLINLARVSEKRRGVAREDGMVGDDMRWAEGREVVEKRIILMDSRGGVIPPVPPKRVGGAGVGGSKLVRRDSWSGKK